MRAFMSILAISLVLILGSISIGVGQSPPSQPMTLVSVTDHTCNVLTTCPAPSTDCNRSDIFYVPSSGNYRLDLVMTCPGGDCSSCQACAVIQQGGAGTAHVSAGCDDPCSSYTFAALDANTPYTLVVCLCPCSGGGVLTCNGCANCYATASIGY